MKHQLVAGILMIIICCVSFSTFSCGDNNGHPPRINIEPSIKLRIDQKITLHAHVVDEGGDNYLPVWVVRFYPVGWYEGEPDYVTQDVLDNVTGYTVTFRASKAGSYFVEVSVKDKKQYSDDEIIEIIVE